MIENCPLKTATGCHILTNNLEFQVHSSTLRAENTSKSRLFKVKSNTETIHNQHQTIWKSPYNFFYSQNGHNTDVNLNKKF